MLKAVILCSVNDFYETGVPHPSPQLSGSQGSGFSVLSLRVYRLRSRSQRATCRVLPEG